MTDTIVRVDPVSPGDIPRLAATGVLELRQFDDLEGGQLLRSGAIHERCQKFETGALVLEGETPVAVIGARNHSARDRRIEICYGLSYGAPRSRVTQALVHYALGLYESMELRTVLVLDPEGLLAEHPATIQDLQGAWQPVACRSIGRRNHRSWVNGIEIFQLSRAASAPGRGDSQPLTFAADLVDRSPDEDGDAAILEVRAGHPVFQTARYCALPLEPSDTPYLRRLELSGNRIQHVRHAGRAPSEREFEAVVSGMDLGCIVVDRHRLRRAGSVVLYGSDYDRGVIHLGVNADASRTGLGAFSSLLAACIDYGFRAYPVDWIEIEVTERTFSQVRAIEKLGFVMQLETVGTTWLEGSWANEMVLSLDRRNWAKVHQRFANRLRPAGGTPG